VATFTVSVSAPFGKDATVQFVTTDGTAMAGTDYTAVSGTLSFPRGSKSPQTITVPITDVLTPGASKVFYINLSSPQNATLTNSQATATIVAPNVAKCQSCGISCNKGDACFTDSCDAVRGCQHVNTSATGTPYCSLVLSGGSCVGTAWVDSDGDGLSDAAEAQGYIDVNANGVYDAGIDITLPGADPNKPDVFLHYDYTVASDHSHNPPAQAIQWIVDAFAAHGINLHIDPQHNAICENAGDSGCITAGTGAHVVALNGSYASCASDQQCASGSVCSGGVCVPDPSCVGTSATSPEGLRAAIPYLELIKPAYHYMIFSHYVGCPGDNAALCANCPKDPTVPACGTLLQGKPSGENFGMSEVFGNDSIVALQPWADIGIPLSSIRTESWSGMAMHEFGHNLGLLHGGSVDAGATACNNYKPNYVSVMSYLFYGQGIQVAASPGDTVPQACITDADCNAGDHAVAAHCSTSTNTCFRIDYSDRVFNTLNEAGGLDETLGLQGGANNTDISSWFGGPGYVPIPTNGSPIDWNKDGNFTDTGVVAEINDSDGPENELPQNDWATTPINGVNNFTNLQFGYQCSANYASDVILPRDLRFGKEEPMVASARLSVEQLLQRSWQEALRMQPPGSWATRTAVQVVGTSGQQPARSAPAVDWLKERPLWPRR
jgi:hypothetical protein